MANQIEVNSERLREYANQIKNLTERLRKTHNSLVGIKYSLTTTSEEKAKAARINSLITYKYRMESCSSFLEAVAEEIERVEAGLLKLNPNDFNISNSSSFFQTVLTMMDASTWVLLSDKEKEKIWKAITDSVGYISEDAKKHLDTLASIYEVMNNPDKLWENGYEFMLGHLGEYLSKTNTGFASIGVDAFINMGLKYPGALIEGQKIFENESISDLGVWKDYGLYLGEKIVVDGFLKTAEIKINTVLDPFEKVGQYLGFDVDFSVKSYWEFVRGEGKGDPDDIKKDMADLGGVIGNGFVSGLNGSVQIIGNTCASVGDFFKDLF